MASLPLSSIFSHFSSNPNLSLNPPHVIKTRTRKPHISQNARITGGQNPSKDKETAPHPHLERRKLLLGMGGLYGAASLDPPALATPIPEPDFRKCSPPTDLVFNDVIPGENCCPPLPGEITDYKLPGLWHARLRPAAHLVSEEYVAKYESAVRLMKCLPDDDPRNFYQQARVHCAYCNLVYDQTGDPSSQKLQIHKSWLFFPWHRWYLYFYERILADLIKDPTFALPYWNWDHPHGMTIPPMFLRKGSQLSDARRDESHARPDYVVDLGYDGTDLIADPDTIKRKNLKLMNMEMAYKEKKWLTCFYGKKYKVGTAPDPGDGLIERGSHTAIHRLVGTSTPRFEDMGNFYSAGRDPLFFSHHANIDRLWSIWCELRKNEGKPWYFQQHHGRRIDKEWGDATFLFYDENKRLVRVKVEDTLDNVGMGYTYQRMELPWIDRPQHQYLSDEDKLRMFTRNVPKQKRRAVASHEFPATLEDTLTVSLIRPAIKDMDNFLEIKDIEVDATKFVRFEVYVNSSSDYPQILDKEYVGSYSQLPHLHAGKVKSSFSLALADALKDLGLEEVEEISVSLVPKAGGEDTKIGGIKITLSCEEEDDT